MICLELHLENKWPQRPSSLPSQSLDKCVLVLTHYQITSPWRRAAVHARFGVDISAPRAATQGHGCLSSDVSLRGLRAAGASAYLLPLLPEAH